MNCNNCRKENPDDSRYCCYCGSEIQRAEGLTTTSISNLTERIQDFTDEPLWGFHLNDSYIGDRITPGWLKPDQESNWKQMGLIIWDRKTKQVAKIWAKQALEIMDELLNTADWYENGITVGEPAINLEVPHGNSKAIKHTPEQDVEWVLINQIYLSGDQAKELLSFLVKKKSILTIIAEQDKKESGKLLAKAYRELLGDEIWEMLGKLYQMDPDEATRLTQDIIRKM